MYISLHLRLILMLHVGQCSSNIWGFPWPWGIPKSWMAEWLREHPNNQWFFIGLAPCMAPRSTRKCPWNPYEVPRFSSASPWSPSAPSSHPSPRSRCALWKSCIRRPGLPGLPGRPGRRRSNWRMQLGGSVISPWISTFFSMNLQVYLMLFLGVSIHGNIPYSHSWMVYNGHSY